MTRWLLQPPRTVRWLLLALIVLAGVGVFSGSDEPIVPFLKGTSFETLAAALHTGNSIIFGVSVSFITGVIVWFFVAWIPEQRKRAILKSNLSRRYQEFREDVVRLLLWATGEPYDHDLPKALSSYRPFQEFFTKDNKRQWYAALNGLQGDPSKLQDLQVELEILASEISYALNNLDVADDQVHSFFKRLTEHIYKLKNSGVYSFDQVKYLGGFLWEVLAQWSMIDGQRENDIIKDMIDRI